MPSAVPSDISRGKDKNGSREVAAAFASVYDFQKILGGFFRIYFFVAKLPLVLVFQFTRSLL